MKLFATALIGVVISTSAVSGMLSGNNDNYRSSLEGDSLVRFELARVVRLQPIQETKTYNVTRTSCTMVEDLSGALAQQSAGAPTGTSPSRMVQRCIPYADREYKQFITGYDVTFEYLGQIRTVRMNHDPGTAVRVKAVTNIYVME
jgi:uncharacterized protein YcfJ